MSRKKRISLIALALLLQTLIFAICGVNKAYIHMDEAYSLGLASYDKVEIQDNADFYNTWHSKEYYEDYLSLQEDEKGDFSPVYINQKNDVHPPLYYLFLRIGMEFDGGHYSKWPGIIINMIIYLFITVFMYLICRRIFKGQENEEWKSIILAFLSSVTMASLTSAMYIRMYALTTLMVVITIYLHMRLSENKDSVKNMIPIGIIALLGSWTHYYYIFFLAAMFVMVAWSYYLKEKKYKLLACYTAVMAVAAAISLAVFPYSIEHMFFGYRGQGFIEKLLDISGFIENLRLYAETIHKYAFNNVLLLIWLVAFIIYRKNPRIEETGTQTSKETLNLMLIPSIAYFLIVAVASPWIELRYVMPICAPVFVLVIYWLFRMVRTVCDEKKTVRVMAILLAITFIAPPVIGLEPQSVYSYRKDIVNKLEDELNVPAVFMFNSEHNRFLDDILLFAKLDQSYIAKDYGEDVDKIRDAFEGKDLSKGIVAFINGGQHNDNVLNAVKKATGLENVQHLHRLNACDVYHVN